MEEEIETFDFALAEGLHMTIEEMHNRLSNREYLAWRAFYNYREGQRQLAEARRA
jgi:hypothetical protein